MTLATRVLAALIRDGYGGLADRIVPAGTGAVLDLPTRRRVALRPDGLFHDYALAEEVTLGELFDVVAAVCHPEDDVEAFVRECEGEATARALHVEHRERVLSGLRPSSPVYYETLAAYQDHPIYPTVHCRHGLSDDDLLAYAPEFCPEFTLDWTPVPRRSAHVEGQLPPWWPKASDAETVLFPVHPLEAASPATAGPRVAPTLSMRTVVDLERPSWHLKLPVSMRTLGFRNGRGLSLNSLRSAVHAERILTGVTAGEPGAPVLLAQERTYARADDRLAWLARQCPQTGGESVVVAALNARDLDGRKVAEVLADRFYGGSVRAFLREYLEALLGWGVLLFVKYGIALHSHQQNLSVVLDHGEPLRLLLKDHDGMVLWTGGPMGSWGEGYEMATEDPRAVADIFVGTTLHLSSAAVAFGLLPAEEARRLLSGILCRELAKHGPTETSRLLWRRTLGARRLRGKKSITAGTLWGTREGLPMWVSGPNYLSIEER